MKRLMPSLVWGLALGAAVLLPACSKPSSTTTTTTVTSVGAPPASAQAPASTVASPQAATPSVPLQLDAGLWQVTYARPEMGYESVQKICVDAVQAAMLAERNDAIEAMPCPTRFLTGAGGNFHIERVCTHNDTTLTSHIDIRMDSGKAFHQTMETIYDPAFAGHADTHTSADGTWVSACPAGMKPGDIRLPDGVTRQLD